MNDVLARWLETGELRILFEYVGLAAGAGDTDYFDINVFRGRDADGDPADDFDGGEEFYIREESLWNGEPFIKFTGASVVDGHLDAGPAQIIVPLSLPIGAATFDTSLTIDSAILSADILPHEPGYELRDGELCGYVTMQQVWNAVNSFAARFCGCLGLNGDLIQGDAGDWTCVEGVSTCEPTDPIEEICGYLGQYCDTATLVFPEFLDVDLDGDPANGAEAISVGATFSATSAVIIDEEPAL